MHCFHVLKFKRIPITQPPSFPSLWARLGLRLLHIPEDSGEGLAQVGHGVLGVVAVAVRHGALAAEQAGARRVHARRRLHGAARAGAADGAHAAALRGCRTGQQTGAAGQKAAEGVATGGWRDYRLL